MVSKQFQRFALVGISNTLICYLSYDLIYRLLGAQFLRAAIAQSMAYCIASMWSYALNKRWTFKNTGGRKNSGMRFAISQLAMYLIHTSSLSLLVDFLHWHARLTWFGLTAIVTVLNFLVLKYWVFPKENSKEKTFSAL